MRALTSVRAANDAQRRKKMPQEVPPWYRIVTGYEPPWSVGPTLPFIVGAIRTPLGDPPPSRATGARELRELLQQMDDDARVGYAVNIQWCPTVNAVVASPTPGTRLSWDPYELPFDSIDTLCGELWSRYGNYISDGNYSKNGRWHQFTEIEKAAILKTLSFL